LRHFLDGMGAVEEDHPGFGDVAAVGDLPFVVRLDQHRGRARRNRAAGLGRTPTTSVRRSIPS
jgi:hypothetical protein